MPFRVYRTALADGTVFTVIDGCSGCRNESSTVAIADSAAIAIVDTPMYVAKYVPTDSATDQVRMHSVSNGVDSFLFCKVIQPIFATAQISCSDFYVSPPHFVERGYSGLHAQAFTQVDGYTLGSWSEVCLRTESCGKGLPLTRYCALVNSKGALVGGIV